MRKFVIGLVVFGVLLALYVGYTRLSGTGPSGLAAPEPSPILEADALEESNGQGAMIGDTEIGIVKDTRFIHTDPTGRPDRVFGFEVLLHKQGDRWQLTNPYMTLLLPKIQCDVIADTGEVQVQTVFGQLVPKDALFRGNVVIHIVPPKPNDPRECFIYLDEVTFVAEKSLFSSTGPVRFVSRSAVLEGVGMELIYDSVQSRLDLFRIIALKSLRLRSADVAQFSDDKERTGPERREPAGQAVAAQGPAGAETVRYECILRRNATIETPERVVIALDLLAITDIPWARSADEGPADDGASAESSEPNAAEMPVPEPLNAKASRQITFDLMPPESFDIVVTSEGGLVVAPMDASDRYLDPNGAPQPSAGVSASLDLQSRRQQAIAQRIEYNATTGDATFIGPVQMAALLDPNSLAGPGSERTARSSPGEPVPMTIAARDAVRYLSASDRVVFDGNCVVSAEKKDPNVTHAFTLSAPTFDLVFAEDANAPADRKGTGQAITLKRFSTAGGQASLKVVRRQAGGLVLGWTKVLASQLEYEAAGKRFTARGEGELQLNNAQITQRHADPNAFGFNQPCYALLSGFDELVFASDTNRIVVAAKSRPMPIGYIPVIDGKYGQPIRGDAGHLDLTLRRTDAGRMEIASLIASGGVTYEDQIRQFVGSTLTYDGDKSLVRVEGDETQPCRLNNALVDHIEMDIAAGTGKTQLRAPTTIQGKR